MEDDRKTLHLIRTASFDFPEATWQLSIVKSGLPRDCLPEYLGKGDSRVVSTITSKSDPHTLTVKRKKFLVGRKYREGMYQLLVYVSQEKLRFETIVSGKPVGEGEVELPWVHTVPKTTSDEPFIRE